MRTHFHKTRIMVNIVFLGSVFWFFEEFKRKCVARNHFRIMRYNLCRITTFSSINVFFRHRSIRSKAPITRTYIPIWIIRSRPILKGFSIWTFIILIYIILFFLRKNDWLTTSTVRTRSTIWFEFSVIIL